jgi:hypothetical protein
MEMRLDSGRLWSILCYIMKLKEQSSSLKCSQFISLRRGGTRRNFGENLYRLVLSLPPLTRKMEDLFPLLSANLCIKLSQNAAGTTNYDDIRRLYKAAFGEGLAGLPLPPETFSTEQPSEGEKETSKGSFPK